MSFHLTLFRATQEQRAETIAAFLPLSSDKRRNCHPPLSGSPVNSRLPESLLHHQRRPFDRILLLQLINLWHRAARRPVTKLKEPHKWPGPADKPLHRITYWFWTSEKAYHLKTAADYRSSEVYAWIRLSEKSINFQIQRPPSMNQNRNKCWRNQWYSSTPLTSTKDGVCGGRPYSWPISTFIQILWEF